MKYNGLHVSISTITCVVNPKTLIFIAIVEFVKNLHMSPYWLTPKGLVGAEVRNQRQLKNSA